ncbi:hypothetical protein KC327_g2040 [Hortaea werneckii]|nr:hypothetical protein KC358_g2014 [Hortaea werneckii]KAI6942669.1 hypothetical protein KC341_g2056 [Hortaea werneckii]KAI6948462.1 hypothetical protein KC348_g1891 [Hortaea werneckii]KAI6980511.1 hypothetical protein KC321_g1732 [Hortaea werneckii]KAI7047591.1 hypothetical protein KC362_g2047 [Hortaea werneckii]
MAIVDIYLRTPTQLGKLMTLDQKRVRTNSGTLDRLLGSLPDSPKHTTLHIKVHDQPFAKVVAIHEAADVLDIKPRQPHIAGFIVGYLSHNKVTPDDMLVVHKCFYDRRGTCKAWRVMVHQVAWWLATSKYTADEAIELKTAATPYPELVDAVDRQIDELFPKKRELAERLAAAEAEEKAYKAKEEGDSQEA